MSRLYRIPRRLVRKTIKPALLWINAWLYKQSEEEVEFLQRQRDCLISLEQREHRNQVKLAQRRNQIARW